MSRSRDPVAADRLVVGLVQMSMRPDPGKNLNRALDLIAEAGAAGAGMVCLP